MTKLDREFYLQDTITVAKSLLGCTLVHETESGKTSGVIVETEAYLGTRDAAAHSYKRKTERNGAMYGPGGFAYVYFIYGMYYCMNVVAGAEGTPEAVLIRALEPAEGIELMQSRRKTGKILNLCSGPGKLCAALSIDKSCYGADLTGDRLYIERPAQEIPQSDIAAAARIGIDYAGEAAAYPWRFLLRGSPYVSVKPKEDAL